MYRQMRSFWSNNSCSPTWPGLFSSWLTSHPPLLLDAHPPAFPLHPIPGCTFGKATPEDIQQLPEFWERWFSSSSRCCIPLERIRRSHDAGFWDIYIVRRGVQVVGSLVRRWVTGLHVKEAYMPKAGIIDFFCVHPAWKRKGVGRTLLYLVHNGTTQPTPPHLMLWESYLPTIPPMSAGLYWKKECRLGKREQLNEAEERRIWSRLVEGRPIWSEYRKSEDLHIYAVASGHVVIWNTWHRRIPQGDTIGIILACTGSLNELYECSPFGLLLADTKYEGWDFNGPFQWGLYNMNTGFISSQFPLLHWM
jgi:GNAT superfamily N-acetyltransferase